MAFTLVSRLKDLGKNLLSRLSGPSVPNKQESIAIERQKFKELVRSKYNISDSRLERLTAMVEYTHQNSGRSREQILAEEENFSRDYKRLQDYSKADSEDFIAKSIIAKVDSIYRTYNGKKSVARIFSELKQAQIFHIGFAYDPVENRYEVNINGKTTDIRDLSIQQSEKQANFRHFNVPFGDYKHVDVKIREQIKQNIMKSLDDYTQKFSENLESLGININYRGFDEVLKSRYQCSKSFIDKTKYRETPRSNNPYSGLASALRSR